MSKTHLKLTTRDRHPSESSSDHEHQAVCGYVRDKVTLDHDSVDCKLCLLEMTTRSDSKKQLGRPLI